MSSKNKHSPSKRITRAQKKFNKGKLEEENESDNDDIEHSDLPFGDVEDNINDEDDAKLLKTLRDYERKTKGQAPVPQRKQSRNVNAEDSDEYDAINPNDNEEEDYNEEEDSYYQEEEEEGKFNEQYEEAGSDSDSEPEEVSFSASKADVQRARRTVAEQLAERHRDAQARRKRRMDQFQREKQAKLAKLNEQLPASVLSELDTAAAPGGPRQGPVRPAAVSKGAAKVVPREYVPAPGHAQFRVVVADGRAPLSKKKPTFSAMRTQVLARDKRRMRPVKELKKMERKQAARGLDSLRVLAGGR